MAGNRILCSCWSSGTFQVYNITLLPVVQLELCTLQCKPSTFYNNNEEKFNYTFISLFNKSCLIENQDRDSFPRVTNHIPPLKLYECFSSPVLFTSHLPLFNLLYIFPLCYLLHIFPSAIHFIAALPAIYIKSPPPLQYTSHFPICYLLHFSPPLLFT